jgi:hypothetical protein
LRTNIPTVSQTYGFAELDQLEGELDALADRYLGAAVLLHWQSLPQEIRAKILEEVGRLMQNE